jgi:hypothetical protein
MAFMSKVFNANVGKFVLHHILAGLTGGCTPKSSKEKALDLQCVKLTKEHTDVPKLVSQWCTKRTKYLQEQGVEAGVIQAITQLDCRFLNALGNAIAAQKDKDRQFDGWLFFDKHHESTGFFELVQCNRGSKDTVSSLVIRQDR